HLGTLRTLRDIINFLEQGDGRIEDGRASAAEPRLRASSWDGEAPAELALSRHNGEASAVASPSQLPVGSGGNAEGSAVSSALTGASLKRLVLKPVALPVITHQDARPIRAGGTVWVAGDGDGLAVTLAEGLRRRGYQSRWGDWGEFQELR